MFLRRQKPALYQRIKLTLRPAKGYSRIWPYLVWRVKRLPGTPEFIAMGLAIGVGINFWPLLFTHLVIGYIFCRLLKGSVIAMFIGTLLGNPWTFAIVYPIMYRIGKVVLGAKNLHHRHSELVVQSMETLWSRIWPIESWQNFVIIFQELFLPLVIGGFLLGLPCILVTYYMTRKALHTYQEQKRKALLNKFDTVEEEIETVMHIDTDKDKDNGV